MTRTRTQQMLVLIVIVVSTIVANVLGATLGSTDTGNIANATFDDSVMFFPATWVFVTIWPVIYFGIVGLAIHQALPSQRDNERYHKGMPMLAGNLVLNAGWVAIFGARLFVLSLVAIIPILVTAVLAYARLGVTRSPEASLAERVLTVPVGIYVAWLTVATVANVALALVSIGWSGTPFDYPTWGVIMLVAGAILGGALLALFRDATFPGVYAYAYLGIAMRRLGEVPPVAITALVGAVLFAVVTAGAVIILFRSRVPPMAT